MQKESKKVELNSQLGSAIMKIKEKMKMLNFNNLHPPYFLHTVTKFREIHLSQFLKQANFNSSSFEHINKHLFIVHQIIEHLDDDCIDVYAYELIEPYTKKMFQENYGFDDLDFKEINTKYNLKLEVEEVLAAASEWFTQIQITQDLFSRIELYFKLKTPFIVEKLREEGTKEEKKSWTQKILSQLKKLASFWLRKGSSSIQTSFFSIFAPGALMLTLAIIGGNPMLPWTSTIDTKTILTSLAVLIFPTIFDMVATGIEKSDILDELRKATNVFFTLSKSVTRFNQALQEAIRNYTLCATESELVKERVNLEKILVEVGRGIDLVVNFDESKIEQMRERTQAYYREYVEIEDGEWTIILPKDEKHPQQ